MPTGLWVVFEGSDGVGKSTITQLVADTLRKQLPNVETLTTKHPGSTPLGRHIRELVKHPDRYNYTIDPLSSQLLMITDHINFKNTILLPALDRRAIILADRCDLISGIIYGFATGLTIQQVNSLINIACQPRIDMLYVLYCDEITQKDRLERRHLHGLLSANINESITSYLDSKKDRFENEETLTKVNQAYKSLITGPTERTIMLNKIVNLDNIQYVNTDIELNSIVENISREIVIRYTESSDDN